MKLTASSEYHDKIMRKVRGSGYKDIRAFPTLMLVLILMVPFTALVVLAAVVTTGLNPVGGAIGIAAISATGVYVIMSVASGQGSRLMGIVETLIGISLTSVLAFPFLIVATLATVSLLGVDAVGGVIGVIALAVTAVFVIVAVAAGQRSASVALFEAVIGISLMALLTLPYAVEAVMATFAILQFDVIGGLIAVIALLLMGTFLVVSLITQPPWKTRISHID